MSTRKANIIKIIVCVILACVMLVGNIVMSYAQEPPVIDYGQGIGSDEMEEGAENLGWTKEQYARFWASLFPVYILTGVGVAGDEVFFQQAYDNFVDIVDGLSLDASISYDDWIKLHLQLNPKDNVDTSVQPPTDFTVNNYVVDETMVSVVNQAVQETISETPLGYIEVAIPSIRMLDTSTAWNSYGQYKSVLEFCSTLEDGYVSMTYWYKPNTTTIGDVQILYVPKSINYAFIGTVTGGITNVQYAINWISSTYPYNVDNRIKLYKVNINGEVTEISSSYNPQAAWRYLSNTTSLGYYGANKMNLMYTGSKTCYEYVFPNINAYKAYNSGSPQPYYLSSEFGYPTGSYSSSNVNTSSVKDAYNQITNNITSGMSADEVIDLVDTILNHFDNIGGSGSGGNGNGHIIDFSSISDLIASLGALIGELITGLAEGLTNIVSAIRSVITTIRENLTNGIIFEWLTELISWLPSEIRTLIIALFTLTVIFACIKLVKGIL